MQDAIRLINRGGAGADGSAMFEQHMRNLARRIQGYEDEGEAVNLGSQSKLPVVREGETQIDAVLRWVEDSVPSGI